MGGRLAMIAFLRAARVGAVWLARNPMLALLFVLVFLLAAVGIRSARLSNRLERAKAQTEAAKKEIEAHETRNEVDNRVAADRDPKRELLRDWSE